MQTRKLLSTFSYDGNYYVQFAFRFAAQST